MKFTYKTTIIACFVGYIVQAIVNNLAPLMFVAFNTEYSIPLSQITALCTFNFGIQLCVDIIGALFADRLGYRRCLILAHLFSAAGLVMLGILPGIMASPFTGLMLSVVVYAIGGGLLEVLVSPVMEACPTDNKETAMSLLHSFYCWGQVGVVLLSTLFFSAFGIENRGILACVWALVPLANMFVFIKTPIAPLIPDGEKGMSVRELFRSKTFLYFFVLMLCAGASEMAVSQWSSTFAEKGLNLSKAAGDLMGPMLFAVLMGTSRAIFGKYGARLNLDRYMNFSSVLCVTSFLLISLVPSPIAGIVGCALAGFSVGIMWPGTFSKATVSVKNGGTAMFALLALAGDLGCSGGPTFVGLISSAAGDNLRIGILIAVLFPLLPLILKAFRRQKA